MIVISRKKNETIVIGERQIDVRVGEIASDKVQLRIQAPEHLRICLYGADFRWQDLETEPESETQTVQREPSTGWAVASCKQNESILVGSDVRIMLVEIRDDKIRLGIEAPKELTVHREEVYEEIRREQMEKGK